MNFKDEITERERTFLKKLCEQKTSKEIGYDMGISRRTVDGIRQDLLLKTNSKSMVGLAIHAIKHEIFQL